MKLFFIRYFKIGFIWLRLHYIFRLFSPASLNLYYLTKFSFWANKNRKVPYNDFPCRWKYEKRFALYQWVLEKEKLLHEPVNYIEFGVADGHSFRWFLGKNINTDSRFYGFDTFTGLPEDFGVYKKGTFNTNMNPPEINDARGKFFQGLFQQTVPSFLTEWDNRRRNIILLDADLFSATLYTLSSLAPFLKKDDIVFFDEFAVPTHEFKAYHDFIQAYPVRLQLIAAANNYYFVAFKVE